MRADPPSVRLGEARPLAGSREIRALGHRFHPMRKAELIAFLFQPRSGNERVILAGANLHGMYSFETVDEYRALLQRPETTVIVDGMPVIWLLRLLGHDVGRDHRTTWVDWFEDALGRAARDNRRVFVLGHSQATLAKGVERLTRRWPDLRLNVRDGFFDVNDDQACRAVVEQINAAKPDVLIVGMGMPKQEIFVGRYASLLKVPVIGLGGAAFAYLAGEQIAPPRWMGRTGLEWLHRLCVNPRRMAGRYLVEPLLLAAVIGRRVVTQGLR